MATARDVVESALREIGVLAEGEVGTASQATDGLVRLNRFIDRLKTERLAIYTITRTTWTIVSGTGTYTLGSGGIITSERPVFVSDVKYQDITASPSVEYPLHRFTEAEWQGVTPKSLTGALPQGWYYNPAFPIASLTLWPIPVPTVSLQGVIYRWAAVLQFAALSDVVTLPPAYEEMLVTNLALLLCPSYERQPNQALVQAARDSMAALKRVNRREMDMSFDAALLVNGRRMGGYNIAEG
jgi:hypothetical protein